MTIQTPFEKLLHDNTALRFETIDLIELEHTSLLNNAHYVTLKPAIDAYSISFLYDTQNILSDDGFEMFLLTVFPQVTIHSEAVLDGIKIFHKMIVENLEKLELFTGNSVKSNACKGSVTLIFNKKNNTFDSIVMTGLLFCMFKDKSTCFYNIKYSYSSVNNFCFILSKDMVSKTLTQFSNNGFICLIDSKMADAFSDVYVDYTKEDLDNVKTLHSMISI